MPQPRYQPQEMWYTRKPQTQGERGRCDWRRANTAHKHQAHHLVRGWAVLAATGLRWVYAGETEPDEHSDGDGLRADVGRDWVVWDRNRSISGQAEEPDCGVAPSRTSETSALLNPRSLRTESCWRTLCAAWQTAGDAQNARKNARRKTLSQTGRRKAPGKILELWAKKKLMGEFGCNVRAPAANLDQVGPNLEQVCSNSG